MGYLTGNDFNWTTLYKLNHDEYEESEETTFSYPAKILPPSPQNIAKTLFFNTDINVILNYNDVSLIKWDGSGNYNNIQKWFDSNNPVSNNIDIDIKSKLDPTLLINTFNDLKRYYKSVTIYYSYNIETITKINNNNDSNFNPTESFNPSKELNSSIEINLKELIFSNSIPSINKEQKFIPMINNDGGHSYAYYKEKYQYQLLNYEFSLFQYSDFKFNNNAIGFDILSNSNDNLNWKINVFINQGKIQGEYRRTGLENAYGIKYISNGNAKIYKIVLNAR